MNAIRYNDKSVSISGTTLTTTSMDWQLKVLMALAMPEEKFSIEDVPKKYQLYINVAQSLSDALEYKDEEELNYEEIYRSLELLSKDVNRQLIMDTINGHLFLEKLIIFNKPLAALSYLRQVKSALLKQTLAPLVHITDFGKYRFTNSWNWGRDTLNSTQSRQLLKENLLKLLPPDVYVATDRLRALICDGIKYQNIEVPSLDSETSLLHGTISQPKLPTNLKYTLNQHSDEVWFIKYSPNGSYLATASKDSKIIVNDATKNYEILQTLQDHSSSVTYLAWSYDSKILLSLSFDQTVCLWDVEKGALFNKIDKCTLFDVPVRFTCAQFISSDPSDLGNYKFVLASSDGKLVIVKANTTSFNIINQYKPTDTIPPQIHDMAISNGYIWTIQPNNTDLLCYSMPDLILASVTPLPATPTSVISLPNSNYLLLNFKSHSVILMNVGLETIGSPYPETLFRLPPSASTPFIVRGCIGYSSNNKTKPALILSGSKTGEIWIWGVNGNIITVVKGHEKLVNCLTWRSNSIEWASASDDHTICVWSQLRK